MKTAGQATARTSGFSRALTLRAPLIEAMMKVVEVRILLWFARMNRTTQYVAMTRIRSRDGDDPLDRLRRIAWSVTAVSRWIPGATCLTQALAGQALLRRYGQGSQIVIGVRPDQRSGLAAHAWLIADDMVLLGGSHAFNDHSQIHSIVVDASV